MAATDPKSLTKLLYPPISTTKDHIIHSLPSQRCSCGSVSAFLAYKSVFFCRSCWRSDYESLNCQLPTVEAGVMVSLQPWPGSTLPLWGVEDE